jgi:hypothetical protein
MSGKKIGIDPVPRAIIVCIKPARRCHVGGVSVRALVAHHYYLCLCCRWLCRVYRMDCSAKYRPGIVPAGSIADAGGLELGAGAAGSADAQAQTSSGLIDVGLHDPIADDIGPFETAAGATRRSISSLRYHGARNPRTTCCRMVSSRW